MHKIIISGVHEIAALVAKIACGWWLGTILPSVRIVRPESETTSFAENSSSRIAIVITASKGSGSALKRLKCFAFSPRRGIGTSLKQPKVLFSVGCNNL
jgi:hypothetical protein